MLTAAHRGWSCFWGGCDAPHPTGKWHLVRVLNPKALAQQRLRPPVFRDADPCALVGIGCLARTAATGALYRFCEGGRLDDATAQEGPFLRGGGQIKQAYHLNPEWGGAPFQGSHNGIRRTICGGWRLQTTAQVHEQCSAGMVSSQVYGTPCCSNSYQGEGGYIPRCWRRGCGVRADGTSTAPPLENRLENEEARPAGSPVCPVPGPDPCRKRTRRAVQRARLASARSVAKCGCLGSAGGC